MDEERFDRWTRRLDRRIPRRMLNGAAVGTLVALSLTARTDARKKKKKKKASPTSCPECATCPSCSPGRVLLANGTCAVACSSDASCAAGCFCSYDTAEGTNHCVPFVEDCADISQVCTSTTQCARGEHCQFTDCENEENPNRCHAVCA